MEDSKENHMPTSSTRTAPSGRPGPVENVHFEFSKHSNAATANGSYERVPDGAPNVPADGVVAPLTTSVVGDINCEVNTETRQQGSQVDRNQLPVHCRHQPTTNEDFSMQEQDEQKYYSGLCLDNVQTNGSAAKEQQHTSTVCVHVGGAVQIVTAEMEGSDDCPQKVEGHENGTDFSDMSQEIYAIVRQYQAARRVQSEHNMPIPAVSTPKTATVHEDEAPILGSGEGEKNKDCSKESKGVEEEDEERLEERESMQRWLIDNC
ncbi:uncharacterized protein LOC111326196 isoform X2 [Stylophora pistillata]|uniref:uncharacterized protein LOC111326196 isoform X2 n=1 Tax=Stylophora pistillata TaxID=50429 RepID=UPI000C04F6D3|nr:uncharacterized protein LOC111326196 isoform X2 [Stylophora pistillata]